MKRAHWFDCVEMKNRIQEQILAERAAMGEEAYLKASEERILADPILGRIWRNAKRLDVSGDRRDKLAS